MPARAEWTRAPLRSLSAVFGGRAAGAFAGGRGRMSSSEVSSAPGWRMRAQDAIHYWEPRRAVYNSALAIVVVAWAVATWPHFQPALHAGSLLRLGVLALGANVCYSAAYVAEVSAQRSAWRQAWRANRWVVWLGGTLLAVVLASYWIVDEIYPSVA